MSSAEICVAQNPVFLFSTYLYLHLSFRYLVVVIDLRERTILIKLQYFKFRTAVLVKWDIFVDLTAYLWYKQGASYLRRRQLRAKLISPGYHQHKMLRVSIHYGLITMYKLD